MLDGLKNKISGGKPILSKTINLRTVESEIAKPLKEVQENNIDVEVGSYPFFKSDKAKDSVFKSKSPILCSLILSQKSLTISSEFLSTYFE